PIRRAAMALAGHPAGHGKIDRRVERYGGALIFELPAGEAYRTVATSHAELGEIESAAGDQLVRIGETRAPIDVPDGEGDPQRGDAIDIGKHHRPGSDDLNLGAGRNVSD